jgi:hypothetical protein
MLGNVPDFQHGLILERMQGVSGMPLFECATLFVRAVGGVQTHAPMRGGISDRIVFGFR